MNCCEKHAERLRDDDCPWCENARLRAELAADGEAWRRDQDRLKKAEAEVAELRERQRRQG